MLRGERGERGGGGGPLTESLFAPRHGAAPDLGEAEKRGGGEG